MPVCFFLDPILYFVKKKMLSVISHIISLSSYHENSISILCNTSALQMTILIIEQLEVVARVINNLMVSGRPPPSRSTPPTARG